MITLPQPDTAETRLARTLFIVEADSYAQHNLWAQHSEGSLYPPWNRRQNCRAYEPLDWEQISSGWLVTVGYIRKSPIVISVNWASIEGQLVMFWYPTSQLVDHVLIDKWLAENFHRKWDNETRRAECDAMNFGHCIQAIKEANKK